MNLVFYGAQKENMDSAEFFCKLEELNVDYAVDCGTGEIGINNIAISQRKEVVQKISEFYDVDYIVSRKEPMELTSFEFDAGETPDVQVNDELIDLKLNELKSVLLAQKLKPKTIEKCIDNFIIDIGIISKRKRKSFEIGEIVSCDFGFGACTENAGRFWVVVLQKTLDSKYLVVPINFVDQNECENTFSLTAIKDVDFVHYNTTYQRETANLYLNRIQEVYEMRLGVFRAGKVTKRFLRKIFDSLSLMKEKEELSLSEELEDLVQVAIWHCAKKETVPEQAEYLFEVMQIPQEFIFLRSAISIALSTKMTVIKQINSIMVAEYETYSSNKIKVRLREEFVTWFKQIYPDIFEKYEKISLADFLKVVVKILEERK